MLRNATNAIWPIVVDDDVVAGARSAFDEPRSFEPGPGQGALADSAVIWPEAWQTALPVVLIGLEPFAPPVAATDTRNRVLIVIPCLNEAGVIESVISRMFEDEGLADPIVVVADGGSTDGTLDIVEEISRRDPRVRLIHNPGRLQSKGLNLVARMMGDDDRPWLVRVDAHAEYPKNYASSLIAEARRTGATSVVVSMETQGKGGFQSAAAAAQNSVLGCGGSAHRSEGKSGWVDHGHHALFRLDVYQGLGGYDESFSHNEDAELDLRLTRAGGRIWLTDRARIVYHPRATPQALWKQYFNYGKGRARTVLKHYQPLRVRQALPLAVAPAVASLAVAPFYWPLAVPALVWALAALTFGVLLGFKHRKAAAFLSGPAAMIMHLAWSTGFWVQLIKARTLPIRPPLRRQGSAVAS